MIYNFYQFLIIILFLTSSSTSMCQEVIKLNKDGTLDKEAIGYKKANYFYGSDGKGGTGYTDQEKDIVDNFYHTGKAQEIIKTECEKDPGLCQGVGAKRNSLAEIAAKMYGVVIQGALGGKVNYEARLLPKKLLLKIQKRLKKNQKELITVPMVRWVQR